MKTPNRALRMIGAAGLVMSMLAVMIAPVSGQSESPGTPGEDHVPTEPDVRHLESAIYFPWVANDDPTLGLGPADTMISIQNLEDRDAEITISGGGGGITTYLSRYASKTFTAEELGIGAGSGGPVWATAVNSRAGFPSQDIEGEEQLFPIFWDDLDNTEFGCFIANDEPANRLPVPPGFAPDLYQSQLDEVPTEFPTHFIANVYIPVHTWERSVFIEESNSWEPVEYTAGPFPAGSLVHLDGTPDQLPEDDDDEDNGQDPPEETLVYDLDVWLQIQEIYDVVNAGTDGGINPFGGLGVGGKCNAWVDGGVVHSPVAIAGVAKMAVNGNMLPFTTEADTAVSGYNALNGWEIFRFDQWYLPIVQTNCGPGGCWDSTIRVAALGGSLNAVTVRFFPADDGSGSLKTGFQLERKIDGGTTWNINLRDYVPEGWVGSAHIYSDGAVYAMVDRYKVGYNMWITNTGSSADYENVATISGNSTTNAGGGDYVLFASHVLTDYYGWNTGINVANLHDGDNNVSIQYFNLFGNATQGLSQRLAAHGMTYFYDPSVAPQDNSEQDVDSDVGSGDDEEGSEGDVSPDVDVSSDIVGSALIWSDYPVAAVIDATKYPESDPTGRADLFQATSYSATQNIYTWQAVPFVSKGTPHDGSGATSGINIMNPNPTAATANVHFVNQSGFNAQNFGTSSVTIPAYANGFVYTLVQENLPNGFYGAAQVISDIPVGAVSANVNYDVDGDGSVIFNAFNPCGFYRTTQGDANSAGNLGRGTTVCSHGDPLDTSGGSVTKTFLDPDGEPIQGIWFSIVSVDSEDFPYQRDGFTGTDGSLTFTNVPVGEYELNVLEVPEDIFLAPNPADTFRLEEGEDLSLVNHLEWAGVIDVLVYEIEEIIDEDDGPTADGEALPVSDVELCLEFGGESLGCADTDADGMATFAQVPASLTGNVFELVVEDGDNVDSAMGSQSVNSTGNSPPSLFVAATYEVMFNYDPQGDFNQDGRIDDFVNGTPDLSIEVPFLGQR